VAFFSTNQSCRDISSGLLWIVWLPAALLREAAYFLFYRVQLTDTFQGFLCCGRLSLYRRHGFFGAHGPSMRFCQRATFTLCAEQPVVPCEGIRLQHAMIVAKMLLRMFPLSVW
jgi:hypothetical protein